MRFSRSTGLGNAHAHTVRECTHFLAQNGHVGFWTRRRWRNTGENVQVTHLSQIMDLRWKVQVI